MNINFHLGTSDIIILVVLILGAILGLLLFLNKKASKKMLQQQEIINRSKQVSSIFVIDKKHSKITDVNLPKIVYENMPKFYKFLKLYFVQAKVGPQIMTLMCSKKIYKLIQVKKNMKVELAGIYIIDIVGHKPKDNKNNKNNTTTKNKSNKKSITKK